mmetsp:Transcript_90403/g.269745  ORF Transcript_90403/g.269745 Transcript_90403/m.269745 type:complete len:561 (-) Transcript_90403:341-2023(-)
MQEPESSPLLAGGDDARYTRLSCRELGKVFVVHVLILPLWLLWLSLWPVALLVLLVASLACRRSLVRAVAELDSIKEDNLVAASWGSVRSLLFAPAEDVDVAEAWPMIPLLTLLLPFVLADCGLAVATPRYYVVKAVRARSRQEHSGPCMQTLQCCSQWTWHLLFPVVLMVQGASRVAAYSWERNSLGGGSYWWHAQGACTGLHSVVDDLTRSEQTRTTARASFRAAVPHAFPPGLLIFLSNDQGPGSAWEEIRRAFHSVWLDEFGAAYQGRLAQLDGLVRESWQQPSLQGLASEDVSLLVSRCIFFVFFGIWVTEEEAAIIAQWRGLAAYFVLPRLVHRLAFNLMLYPIMSLRAQTLGMIRRYRLEHIFSSINAGLSPANRRPVDVQICDELMFAIGFAGIGGTTAGTVSVGRFLMALGSADASGAVDFGNRDRTAMTELFLQSPRKFIQETCRISSPVGTCTTVLKGAQDLGLLGGGRSPAGTLLAGAINMSNLDPAVFPEPMRFDPGRSNLEDALTWNGKAFGADEACYPRLCPGRHLAVEVISVMAHTALGVARTR